MKIYTHALVLVQGKEDGVPLLALAITLSSMLQMKITIAHICNELHIGQSDERCRIEGGCPGEGAAQRADIVCS
jgi:hypothetical protein